MALFDTINDFAKNVGERSAGTLEATKLITEIAGLKKVIVEAQQKIGEHCYQRITSEGKEPDPEVLEFFEQITVVQGQIDEKSARIAAIKAAQANPLAPGKKRCENCGAIISVKDKFCSECGTENHVEEAEEVVEEAAPEEAVVEEDVFTQEDMPEGETTEAPADVEE